MEKPRLIITRQSDRFICHVGPISVLSTFLIPASSVNDTGKCSGGASSWETALCDDPDSALMHNKLSRVLGICACACQMDVFPARCLH